MKTLKKTKIVTALIGALSILSFTIIFTGGSIAHANPDYICFKVTYDSPCNITSYSAWDRATKSRIATGYQVTSVYYYSVRIGCEGGDSGYVVGSAGWASGRRTPDYINSSTACSIVQYDYNSPSGNPLIQ